MPPSTPDRLFEQFRAAADAVALARPDVDPDIAREVFLEAATLIDNGLVLDGLDEHDTDAVAAGLCLDLVAADPGAAIRARANRARTDPGDLHDPDGAFTAYLLAASALQL